MGEPAVFVAGLLARKDFDATAVSERLSDKYGDITYTGAAYSFDFTDYYEKEMGGELHRHWLVFSKLFLSERITRRKKYCQKLEDEFENQAGHRRINIDPGYVTGAKFVLSSHKNNAHRICLEEDIYAEITLIYRDKAWRPLEWTYPEFRQQVPGNWLERARNRWLDKV